MSACGLTHKRDLLTHKRDLLTHKLLRMSAGVCRPLLCFLGVSYPVGVRRPEGLMRPPVFSMCVFILFYFYLGVFVSRRRDAPRRADTSKADTSKADTSKADTSKADTSTVHERRGGGEYKKYQWA